MVGSRPTPQRGPRQIRPGGLCWGLRRWRIRQLGRADPTDPPDSMSRCRFSMMPHSCRRRGAVLRSGHVLSREDDSVLLATCGRAPAREPAGRRGVHVTAVALDVLSPSLTGGMGTVTESELGRSPSYVYVIYVMDAPVHINLDVRISYYGPHRGKEPLRGSWSGTIQVCLSTTSYG